MQPFTTKYPRGRRDSLLNDPNAIELKEMKPRNYDEVRASEQVAWQKNRDDFQNKLKNAALRAERVEKLYLEGGFGLAEALAHPEQYADLIDAAIRAEDAEIQAIEAEEALEAQEDLGADGVLGPSESSAASPGAPEKQPKDNTEVGQGSEGRPDLDGSKKSTAKTKRRIKRSRCSGAQSKGSLALAAALEKPAKHVVLLRDAGILSKYEVAALAINSPEAKAALEAAEPPVALPQPVIIDEPVDEREPIEEISDRQNARFTKAARVMAGICGLTAVMAVTIALPIALIGYLFQTVLALLGRPMLGNVARRILLAAGQWGTEIGVGAAKILVKPIAMMEARFGSPHQGTVMPKAKVITEVGSEMAQASGRNATHNFVTYFIG